MEENYDFFSQLEEAMIGHQETTSFDYSYLFPNEQSQARSEPSQAPSVKRKRQTAAYKQKKEYIEELKKKISNLTRENEDLKADNDRLWKKIEDAETRQSFNRMATTFSQL